MQYVIIVLISTIYCSIFLFYKQLFFSSGAMMLKCAKRSCMYSENSFVWSMKEVTMCVEPVQTIVELSCGFHKSGTVYW